MLKIEKEFNVTRPSVAQGIVQELLTYYNTLTVKKSVEKGKIVVRAVIVGPYVL